MMPPASAGAFVVYLTHIISREINTFPLKQEMPFIFPDKNVYGIYAKIPVQFLNFIFGSGFGDHHGQIFAAIC
jgi:hypothetical protein